MTAVVSGDEWNTNTGHALVPKLIRRPPRVRSETIEGGDGIVMREGEGGAPKGVEEISFDFQKVHLS